MWTLDKGSTVHGVREEQPNMASSSQAADGGWVSDKKTETLFAAQRSNSQSQDSVGSWQTVVVTASSIVVLLFVTFLAAWKLHQSTRSNNSRIVS